MYPLQKKISSSRKKMRRKQILYLRQRGRCFWCGNTMVSTRSLLWRTLLYRKHNNKIPLNLATLEHLDCRYSPLRGKREFGVETTVLACSFCNDLYAELCRILAETEHFKQQ